MRYNTLQKQRRPVRPVSPELHPSVEWATNVGNIRSLIMSNGKVPFRMNPVYALPSKTSTAYESVPEHGRIAETRHLESKHQETPITSPSRYMPPLHSIQRPIRLDRPNHKLTLDTYKLRDSVYQQTLNLQHKRHIEIASQKKQLIEHNLCIHHLRSNHQSHTIFNKGYKGWANGSTGISFRIIFPQQRIHHRSKAFQFPINDIRQQADQQDVLVPIRLDIEHSGYVLRDTFTWNINERLITPCDFAQVMCEDMMLPINLFKRDISKAIKDQLNDYQLNYASKGSLDNLTKLPSTLVVKNDRSFSLDTYSEWRVLIKLDIIVGSVRLIDQFEWDIDCHDNSPEIFAEKLTAELGLGGEFRTAIAHAIREQIYVHTKNVFQMSSSLKMLSKYRGPSLKLIVRDLDGDQNAVPIITDFLETEINKKTNSYGSRRKKRQTSVQHELLPPRLKPFRTHRACILPLADDKEDEGLGNMVPQLTTATERVEFSMQSQRKSAHRARLIIAADAAYLSQE